jgi:hypothetical protein
LFEVDFSNEIGRNPSLSQLDEWLSDAFQPPKRHVPEREQSTVSLAPSATPSVEPAKQTRVQEESPITEEQQINVEYITRGDFMAPVDGCHCITHYPLLV